MSNVNISTLREYWANVSNAVANVGSAIKGQAIQVAGSDGTNARIIKTNANGEVLTQLSGSTMQNAVILQTVTATFNSLAAPNQITYGKTWKTSAANSFPVEIGKYRERVIAVHNNTDKVLNSCQIRQQFVTTKGLTHPVTLHEVADIPAGSRVIFTKKNVPELALPFLGMFFQHNVGESGTITGTVEVTFVGGVL